MKNTDKINREIVIETGICLDIVERVVRSQFQLVHDTMESATLEKGGKPIRLQYFGIFSVKPGKLYKVREADTKFRERLKAKKAKENL